MNAYTLSDRATWSKFANKQHVALLVEGDKRLFKQYGVILVNPKKHPDVKVADGQAFIDWADLTGGPGRHRRLQDRRRPGPEHPRGAGERDSALEEAAVAYRAALQEYTRERVPLDWATAQVDLATAFSTLGARESGTARLEEAVAAYRAALQEYTRERVPLDWAETQNNLGLALEALGEREGGTVHLEEAVAAFRAAGAHARLGAAPMGEYTVQSGKRVGRLGGTSQRRGPHAGGNNLYARCH